MQFEMAFNRFNRVVLTALGSGPKRTTIELDDARLRVRMGIFFDADVPRSHIVRAGRVKSVNGSSGVHGWRGKWLVNGRARGVVGIEIDPPVRARAIGMKIDLRQLAISPADPDAFLAALDVAKGYDDA